jgi:nitrite reductase/ring-hydroxylating ferredoxin subunit
MDSASLHLPYYAGNGKIIAACLYFGENVQADRRGIMAFLMGIFRAMIGKCDTKELDPGLWSIENSGVRVKLGEATELSVKGGAVYLQGKGLDTPVLIVRTEDDRYLAFANKCTHGGRKIDHVPGESKLRCCSIGHSTYDYDGNVLKGMAKRPIAKYQTEQSGTDLIVKL